MAPQTRPPVSISTSIKNFDGRPDAPGDELCIWGEYRSQEILSEYQHSYGWYYLWFPLPALDIVADVDICIAWLALDPAIVRLTVDRDDIRRAASEAVEWDSRG
jgi:hypothetical protein